MLNTERAESVILLSLSFLESQLQMAIINQMYYNDKNPEEIFGTVRLDLAREMVDSMDLWNTELPFLYSSDLPPNFV